VIVTYYIFRNHQVDPAGGQPLTIEAAYTYDDADAAPRMLSAWVDNKGAGPVRFLIRRNNGQVFTIDCVPGQRLDANFNNSQSQRWALDLSNPLKPQPTDFSYTVQYPPIG
jgi:hypothetical protein